MGKFLLLCVLLSLILLAEEEEQESKGKGSFYEGEREPIPGTACE